jgi:peptidoglycan/xylan/chitin deacetylase (PgdA/CDA1 family)
MPVDGMSAPLLALKVDVDTWRGTREGVPALAEALRRHRAEATFLFSLGPDHTGRAIRRVFRPGFLSKVSRTSVVEHYGMRTLLYGTLLPGPDIGRREAARMRRVRDAGFEVGIHTWDHIRWQDQVAGKDAAWTEREMRRAVERYTDIFGSSPRTHGAAGWQMNPAAYALERDFGFDYASDGRGTHPFQPVDADGMPFGVPQLPTTLPTLDELIGADGLTPDNVHEHLLALTAEPPAHGHVYTLHAELEGMKLLPAFERLLAGWRAQGYRLVSTGELFASLDAAALPLHRVVMGEIPGRSGALALQGACINPDNKKGRPRSMAT